MKAIDIENLIEINNEALISTERRVPFEKIRQQHKKRYIYQSSIGDIVMRRIRQADLETTVLQICEEDKEYAQKANRCRALFERAKYDEPLSIEDMTELEGISAYLTPYSKRITLPCFIDPALNTTDDYDTLMGALQAFERLEIESILQDLVNPNMDGEINMDILRVAEAMGLKAFDDMKIEEMTAQQYNAVRDSVIKEAKG